VTTAAEILRALRARAREPYGPEVERDGRPAIGSFCLYAPPEVSLAAGALPLRIRGGAEAEDSASGDALMSTRCCSFVRKAVSLILDGRYPALEGVICLNTCDHVRRAFDVLASRAGLPFRGFLSVPRALRPELYPYYLEELRSLHAALCAHLGRGPDDEALRAAIRTTNAVRARLRELDELRGLERPKLSGADALAVQLAAATMPPEAFLALADELLAALRASEGLPAPRARLLLCGGELDEPDYVAALESQGALVVADDLCFGARAAAVAIPEDAADPLDAIGRATFFRPPCARMIGAFPERHEALGALAARARVDGVVFQRLLFCDPWGADQHNLRRRAASPDALPLLTLTREHGAVPTGQLRTRVQAFVERLELRRGAR
jgi:benzoyl-CoA reductase/2-hydroxyglutaryl-CoA dehydratase subunit BcrC/BadD/HgdB